MTMYMYEYKITLIGKLTNLRYSIRFPTSVLIEAESYNFSSEFFFISFVCQLSIHFLLVLISVV